MNTAGATPTSAFESPDRSKLRERMARVYDLVFERRLTNFAGGNMTVRASDQDTFFITAHGATRQQLGRMGVDDIIHVDGSGKVIEGKGEVSVEFECHSRVIREFDGVEAVIHTHSPYATMFAARMKPIPAFIDSALAYGTTEIVPDTYRYSTTPFIDDTIQLLSKCPSMPARGGAAVLYPRHGVLVAHRSLELAIDLAERIEWNAMAVAWDRSLGTVLPRTLPEHADKPGDRGVGG